MFCEMAAILFRPQYVKEKLYFSDEDEDEAEMENEDTDPNAGRFVRYQFTPQFLKLKTVGAT